MKFTSCLFGALALFAFSGLSHAAYIPPNFESANVPPPGHPDFLNDVKLSFAKTSSGYKLTAQQTSSSFTFNSDPTHTWTGKDGSFSFTANFNSSLQFTGGNVTLKGKLPGYDGPGDIGTIRTTTQKLWSSSLSAAAFDLSPVGLGFRTVFSSASGWAKQFARVDESVWFYNADLWSAILSKKAFTINAKAVTTVPVPAPLWLFGSGLTALLASRRRRCEGLLAA